MDKRIQVIQQLVIGFVICVIFAVMLVGLFGSRTGQKTLTMDVDGDGCEEVVTKKLGTVTVRKDGDIIWKSDRKWKCDDFLVADIDRDGYNELMVLLWKQGSFGEHLPFWMEQDIEISQHIFIFSWDERQDRMVPIWMSSRLSPEIRDWNIEKECFIHILSTDGEDMLWMWKNWGLVRIDNTLVIK